MITVMRQRSFHKPNGCTGDRLKARGRSGKQLKIFKDILPYVAYGENHTKSMKQIYKEVILLRPNSQWQKEMRKLRRKLANMKMPMPVGRGANPKKDRSARRPRCVVWPSEQNPSPRYKRDGSVRK